MTTATTAVLFANLVSLRCAAEAGEAIDSVRGIGGAMISEFEKEIAKIWASSSLASPTHCGLHIAAGLGPGSIIYAVPNTFIATAVSIVQTGADLCVVDVEPDTSLSATYKDRQAGTLGLAAAFSFYPRKNLDASAARAAP